MSSFPVHPPPSPSFLPPPAPFPVVAPPPWTVVPQYRSDALLDALFLLVTAYLGVTCVREMWCRRVARANAWADDSVVEPVEDDVHASVEDVAATHAANDATYHAADRHKEEPPTYADVA